MARTSTHASVDNVNIEDFKPLISPENLKRSLSIPRDQSSRILTYRETVVRILDHRESALLFITGPCSIHDTDAAVDYARRLERLAARHAGKLFILMRVYFEKPRTSLGWRGLIVDPWLDGSQHMQDGLIKARRLLLELLSIGVPVGTEVLDPIIPQYIADLVSWASIGARTTESQTHREIASGLSMPVGFKNSTDGDLSKAVNAVLSARYGHSFVGIDQNGRVCVLRTRGNRTGHVIMRGGEKGPNYHERNIESAENLLSDIGVRPSIIVDCSHANSGKDPQKQAGVLRTVLKLRRGGHDSIRGIMLESNLVGGRQDVDGDTSALTYGKSITDACISWEETEELIDRAAASLPSIP